MYHFETRPQQVEKNSSTRTIYVLGFLMFAGLLHLMQWNQFAGEIVPLKFKQLLNVANSDELYRVGQICQKLKKWDCRKTALLMSYSKDSKNEKAALELGLDLMKRKEYLEALKIYQIYFTNKGQNLEARYKMAVALSELKRFKEAKPHFQFVLKLNKNTVDHPQYVRTFVHYLIQNQDYSAAKNLIALTRKKNKNAAYFLEKELQQIDFKLKTSS